MKNKTTLKTGEKKQRIPEKSILLYCLIGLIAFCVLAVFFLSGPFSGHAVVAFVENEPVTAQEFRQQILLKRGEVIAYFRMKYGVEAGAGFWTHEYSGEVPTDVVKKEALDETIKIKMQLILAKREGFIDDISYQGILKGLKEENKKRNEAIANKQVIFGLREYNERTYLYYIISTLANKLKNKLSEKWNLTDPVIRNYYEEVKKTYYVDGRSYTPFDKVKENLRSRYIDLKYNEFIDSLAKDAQVRVNENVYKKIKTDK